MRKYFLAQLLNGRGAVKTWNHKKSWIVWEKFKFLAKSLKFVLVALIKIKFNK